MSINFQLGLTKSFPCSYLNGKEERLLVAVDDRLHDSAHYTWLMSQGFRRSGNEIYRPHCESCNACQSLRVLINDFTLSKSQRRLLKRNQHFITQLSDQAKDCYYPLYERYINTLHQDGSMFPATLEQYNSFMSNTITEQHYLEIWHEKTLISVAVMDDLPDALSAVYTFYDPEYRKYALGVYSIIKQIELAKKLQRDYLYLGYQIDDCQKMNYKNKYKPYQILKENQWKTINK